MLCSAEYVTKKAYKGRCVRRRLQCFSNSWIFLQHSLVTVNSFKINYSCHPSWIVVCVWKGAMNCACKTAAEGPTSTPKPWVSCLLNTNDICFLLTLICAKELFNHGSSLWRTGSVTLSVLLTCMKGLSDVPGLRYSQIKLSHRESSGWFLKNQRRERALELLLKTLMKQF